MTRKVIITKNFINNRAFFGIRIEENGVKIINELNRFDFVRNAALVSFNGDYAG